MKVKITKISWNPNLPIFSSEPFLNSVSSEYGWIAGISDNGNLRCILPFVIIKKAILRMIRFPAETIPFDKDLDIEQERHFLNSAVKLLRSQGADMIIPASTNALFRSYPTGAIAVPYGSYVIDLSKNQKAIWSKVSSSHRRKVRLALKAGVAIKNGLEYVDLAYKLVRETFARSSLPFMKYRKFRKFVSGLGDFVKIFVADYQGRIQGCAIFPFSRHSSYYVYGGSIQEPQKGAMHLLHWEAIRMFKDMGIKKHDFCGARINPQKGSKQEGINIFKERFGGDLHKGYMWKLSFHPAKFYIYSLASKFRSAGDIVDQERHRHNQNASSEMCRYHKS